MVARQAAAQLTMQVLLAGLADADQAKLSTRMCGAITTTALTRSGKRAAWISAMEPPSLWPSRA